MSENYLEDEPISEPQEQNITNSQNESDILDINESVFEADSINSDQSNDTKIKGIQIIFMI